MEIRCRQMLPSDFGVVESCHWKSAEHVRQFIEKQSIASMLAFDGDRCVGQLYLQEYDPGFSDPKGWIGHRPFADFQIAEPLDLHGRFLTLGCYHVGYCLGRNRAKLFGQGIGTALLKALVEWYRSQEVIGGLISWAFPSGSHELLQWMGQMCNTIYQRFDFREVKKLRDPRWTRSSAVSRLPG